MAKNKQRAKLALAELEKEMEILSKEEASACKGGYSTGWLGGSGTDEDPYRLSEVVVYGGVTGNTSFVDVTGAFCFGNGIKAELIQQLDNTGGLSTGMHGYLKAVKGLGYVGAAIQIMDSATNVYNDISSGGISNVKFQDLADIGFTVLGTFGGPIGLGAASVYYIYRVSTE